MNELSLGEHEKELLHRLVASGVDDAEFLKRFFERHEIESELKYATSEGSEYYEDTLVGWVETAEKDYKAYGLRQPEEVQEGEIRPKKRRRTRKPKDISEPSERQDALGQYLARVVSKYERIIDFRNNILSGHVLSDEESLTFLSSPLAAAKSRADFKTFRANPLNQILDTNYQVKEDQDDSGPYRKLVWGSGHSHTVRPLDIVGTNLVFPGEVTDHDLRGSQLRGDRAVIFPHPREEGRFVVARPESTIAELVRLAEVSLGGFPISMEKGVWFILTGKFIPEDPVRIRYRTIQRPYLLSRTTITLEVECWLPPEEVLEQYRHAQHQILGRTPRSLKRRTVALFEFVNQHKERKSWRKLFDAWNEAHPSQRFRDRSHLCTTNKRALDNIASPPTLSKL